MEEPKHKTDRKGEKHRERGMAYLAPEVVRAWWPSGKAVSSLQKHQQGPSLKDLPEELEQLGVSPLAWLSSARV